MRLHHLLLTSVALALAGCAVGPEYQKPELPVPAAFKGSDLWKVARPLDHAPRGQWWQMFCDRDLNQLQELLLQNNQNIKIAEARFRQARALVGQARAGFFPDLTLGASTTRSKAITSGVANRYEGALSSSWEIDLWGRIRRTLEASNATADASQADLSAALLSAQADLVSNYIGLRIADEQQRLLDETVAAYAKSLELTENLYNTGIQTRSDYLQAKVQLESARAQALNIGIQRAAYEHAIATLIGKAPADFSLTPTHVIPSTPALPPLLPSEVLERRPDIAAAERRVASANAEIGVARSAFFPKLTFASAIGYSSTAFGEWFTTPARIWSLGPDVVLPLFDAGLRIAQTDEAIARYDETVATYRQTVLAAFQEVEDNLAALRILEQEVDIRKTAAEDARASTEVITNQYKEGITSYLNVANAQTTELNNTLSALLTRQQRLLASVNLIRAIGGTWRIAPTTPVSEADVKAPTS